MTRRLLVSWLNAMMDGLFRYALIIMLLSWTLLMLSIYWILSPHEYELVRQYSFEEEYIQRSIDAFEPKYQAQIYTNRVGVTNEGHQKYHLLRLAFEADSNNSTVYSTLDMLVETTPTDFKIGEYFNRLTKIDDMKLNVLAHIVAKRYQRLELSQQEHLLKNFDESFQNLVLVASQRVEEIEFRH